MEKNLTLTGTPDYLACRLKTKKKEHFSYDLKVPKKLNVMALIFFSLPIPLLCLFSLTASCDSKLCHNAAN